MTFFGDGYSSAAPPGVGTQTLSGTANPAAATDVNWGYTFIDNAAANTYDLPDSTVTPLPVGVPWRVMQIGAGVTTITIAGSDTINGVAGNYAIPAALTSVMIVQPVLGQFYITTYMPSVDVLRGLILNTTDLPQEVDANRVADPLLIFDSSGGIFKFIYPADITAKLPTRNVTTSTYTITTADRDHLIRCDFAGTCTVSFDLYANQALPNNTMIYIQSATDNDVVIDKLDAGITLNYRSDYYQLVTDGKLEVVSCRIDDTDSIDIWGGLKLL